MPFKCRNSPRNSRSVASGLHRHRLEFRARDAVVDDAHEPARLADLAAEHVGAKGAFEQKQVAAQHQEPLGGQIKFAGERVVAEEQAAAMRRIGAHGARAADQQPGIGAALGAVPVHDVGICLSGPAHHMGKREQIARIGLAAHGDAAQAERQRRLDRAQRRRRRARRRCRSGDQPDADGRARSCSRVRSSTWRNRPPTGARKHVQDVQRFIASAPVSRPKRSGCRHRSNPRRGVEFHGPIRGRGG